MPQKSMNRRYGALVGAAVVAIMASFLLVANNTVTRRHENAQLNQGQARTDHVICERVNRVYLAIQQTVRVGLASNPKIAYYKRHPADLARVQHQLEQELATFAPQPCPKEGP